MEKKAITLSIYS